MVQKGEDFIGGDGWEFPIPVLFAEFFKNIQMAPGGIFFRIGRVVIEKIPGCMGYFHVAPPFGVYDRRKCLSAMPTII